MTFDLRPNLLAECAICERPGGKWLPDVRRTHSGDPFEICDACRNAEQRDLLRVRPAFSEPRRPVRRGI